MDKEQLVEEMKALSLSLGRTPYRYEFLHSVRGARHWMEKVGTHYQELLDLSGLAPIPKERISNKVFETPIEQHLQEYIPRPLPEDNRPTPRAAFISDIHWPFSNQRVLDKFYRHIEKTQPEWVVLDGDAWDMYSHGKFPRSHNLFTPQEEEDLAHKMNSVFWEEVQKAVKKVKCIQTLGNHDVRPLKRQLEALPSMHHWIEKHFKEMFTFPGVDTILDYRQEVQLGNVLIHHGYRSKLGDHRDYVMSNIVVGHTHMAGIVYRRLYGRTIWEMNIGYAGDPEAKGLTYTPQKMTNWTPAFGETDEDGPRVILC